MNDPTFLTCPCCLRFFDPTTALWIRQYNNGKTVAVYKCPYCHDLINKEEEDNNGLDPEDD